MKVLKFGGTSVGSVESLKNVKKIVESIDDKAIIVVSALGGLTDKLISTANMARNANSEWKVEMEGIAKRHKDIIDTLVPSNLKEEVNKKVSCLLSDLSQCYQKVDESKHLSESMLNEIVSYGERMSSVIVAGIIENGRRFFSPDFIITEKRYGKDIVEMKETEALIISAFKNMGPGEKAIVPGFISKEKDSGRITNLGRGGSDYTAALIAAALNAEILEIWTDVDGFMTSDPRVVSEAKVIDCLSFTESMELCSFGAKVVYPPTIYPVFHKNIPIKILNTFNPEAPGTLITDKPSSEEDVKGISALKGMGLISISMRRDEIKTGEILKKITEKGVTVIPVSVPESYNSFSFCVPMTSLNIAEEELKKELGCKFGDTSQNEVDIEENLAALAIVGKTMGKQTRLLARIAHSLGRKGISVKAYSADSDTTVVYLIEEEKNPEALPLIHSLIW